MCDILITVSPLPSPQCPLHHLIYQNPFLLSLSLENKEVNKEDKPKADKENRKMKRIKTMRNT